jgi:polysaccharide deacetylase family protein (PEP-CTERM system associated)
MQLGNHEITPIASGAAAHALTVDVEDWFHSNFQSAPHVDPDALPRRVEGAVDRVLELFEQWSVTATFFVLGCVARDHPGLVRRLADAGHEIGCHSMNHTLIYEQSIETFRDDVTEARKLLSDQSGQDVVGFRAPSWSITERSLWALDALAASGFQYDSSIFPAANYLYGIADAPRDAYQVRTENGGRLVEVPPPIYAFGRFRFGVGGGFYLRVLPFWIQRRALERYEREGMPFLIYVHPREFDPDSWTLRLPLSVKEHLIHRARLRAVRPKIARLVAGRRWRSLGEILRARGLLGR